MSDEPSTQKPVAVSTYLIISAVSLLAAIAIGYYYFHSMKQNGTEKMDNQVFYLVLVLFGIAVSALIFGIMNSYAALNGVQSVVTYKFTGPVVGVILTVLGGFILHKCGMDQLLFIHVSDQDNNPIT